MFEQWSELIKLTSLLWKSDSPFHTTLIPSQVSSHVNFESCFLKTFLN